MESLEVEQVVDWTQYPPNFSDEEKKELLKLSRDLKDQGNIIFNEGEFEQAIDTYTKSLHLLFPMADSPHLDSFLHPPFQFPKRKPSTTETSTENETKDESVDGNNSDISGINS